jgi:hypothetical protein
LVALTDLLLWHWPLLTLLILPEVQFLIGPEKVSADLSPPLSSPCQYVYMNDWCLREGLEYPLLIALVVSDQKLVDGLNLIGFGSSPICPDRARVFEAMPAPFE